MRLLFVIHALQGGGAERVLVTLATSFYAKGHEVGVLCDTRQAIAYPLPAGIRLFPLRKGCRDHSLLAPLRMRRNLRACVRRERPDVVVAFMSALGCATVVATLGLGVPVVISEHTNVTRYLGLYHAFRRRLVYPLAACVTVLTHHDARLWHHRMGNVVRMPNPMGEVCGENTTRRRVVLAVGGVQRWQIKGFDTLLRAWGAVCRSCPGWTLEIAGEAPEAARKELEEVAREAGAERYRFLGFRSDVARLMKSSEVFCLSSRVEGLPMALIEAMNNGCCCVSFDVETGPREIIRHLYNGLLVENQNTVALGQAIRRVIDDEDLRHTLRAHARESVSPYDTEAVVRRWNILFDKLCKK